MPPFFIYMIVLSISKEEGKTLKRGDLFKYENEDYIIQTIQTKITRRPPEKENKIINVYIEGYTLLLKSI